MKSETRQLLEILGVVAVIASLIFVGMQLMLDRRVALAEQYFNRAEAQRSDLRSMLESDTWFQVQQERWQRGLRPSWWEQDTTLEQLERMVDDNEVSINEVHLQGLESQIGELAFDNLYFQYRQGLLSEEDWAVYRGIMKNRMDSDPVDFLVFSSSSRPVAVIARELRAELESEQ